MTATFLDCLYDREELLLTGYARLLKVSYDIPLDIVATCHVFLASYVTIPEITVSDSDDTDDDHLCEDEIAQRQSLLQHELFGIYKFIRNVKIRNVPTSSLYHSKLITKYKNSYYSLKRGTNVIIYKTNNIFDNDVNAKQILKQLQIHHILAYHPHIQNLYDVVPPTNSQYFNSLTFIFEFIPSNLYQIFRSNQFFDAMQIKYITYQMLLALKYIHKCNIIHGNLRPEHVLIAEDCSVKISNFRHSEFIDLKQKKKNATNASHSRREKKRRRRPKLKRSRRLNSMNEWYKAPELLLSKDKNVPNKRAADIWSIGMIFAELLQMLKANRPPRLRSPLFPTYYRNDIDHALCAVFEVIGSPKEEEMKHIKDETVKHFLCNLPQHKFNKQRFKRKYYPGIDDHALDFLRKLLQFDPNKRMTVDEALNHSYLNHHHHHMLNIRNPVYERMIKNGRKHKLRRYIDGKCTTESVRECILKEIRKFKTKKKKKKNKRDV